MPPKPDEPAKTFDAYAAGFPPDVEEILHQLRATIRKVAPGATEGFKYGMPVFRYAGTYLYVGAWKKHVGLYPVHTCEPELEAELAPLRSAQDTIKLLYSRPIPYALVARIARARIGQT